MDMRWSPRVPVGKAQQFTNRSIIRDRITARLDRPEIDLSVLIGSQPATQVHFGLAGILIFIETVPVRQPDIDQRIRSEEHTSELQSLMRISYAVFCLKKKNTKH